MKIQSLYSIPGIRRALADARRLVMLLGVCMLLAQAVEASHDHLYQSELEACPICLQWLGGDAAVSCPDRPSLHFGTTSFCPPSYAAIFVPATYQPQQLRGPPHY